MHGQGKGEQEFRPVVDLNFLKGKWEGLPHRSQEVETGTVRLVRIQTQDALTGTVIEGRVLKAFLAGALHFLDIELHTLAGLLFAEEDQVA